MESCSIIIRSLKEFYDRRGNEIQGHYNQHDESLSLDMQSLIAQHAIPAEEGLISCKVFIARADELAGYRL